jgi:hypothetical protein
MGGSDEKFLSHVWRISGPVLHKTVPGRVVPWILRSMAETSRELVQCRGIGRERWRSGQAIHCFSLCVGLGVELPVKKHGGADVEFCKHMRPQQTLVVWGLNSLIWSSIFVQTLHGHDNN